MRASQSEVVVTDIATAARSLARQAVSEGGGEPLRGAFLYATADVEVDRLLEALASELGPVPIVGCTSCRGVGSLGFDGDRPAVGGLWLAGEDVSFGVGQARCRPGEGRERGAEAVRQAFQRSGLAPDRLGFVVVHATPGEEENVLLGLLDVLPATVPILGGSGADDDLSGRWAVWGGARPSSEAVAVAVCSWPGKIGMAFQSGYLPAGRSGVATRVEGRILREIDGRPAAEVYDQWIRGALREELLAGGPIAPKTALRPLGVVRGQVLGIDHYVLVHPERVHLPERSLGLFADLEERERVFLMHSNPRSLVQRPEDVARQALDSGGLSPDDVVGSLMIYCAGCLTTIVDEADAMVSTYRRAVGDAPSVAAYTYGEQGCILTGRVDHGNLMAGVLVLSDVPGD